MEGVVDTVVIKADSEYLIQGMAERVVEWQVNGWRIDLKNLLRT
jgi:ribonuclease HI